MADASSGSSGGSGNSGRSHRSNHRRSCNVSKGSSSHSPASNSVSSWARLNWPSTSDNSLGNGTEIYGSIDDDREMAKKAVAFVLNSTSKGVVSLCSEVSSILKAKRSLERTVALQRKELDSLRSALSINGANHSSVLLSSEESNRSQKREPQFKTNQKPLLIHRSTSPVRMIASLNSCASQTEISSIQEWTHSRNILNSVEQENIKLKNDMYNLQNELESIKRKGSLPQIICESQGTVCKTVGLSSSPSNENEIDSKSKIISQMSPCQRQMETLNQDLELPHIPQAKYQGQAQDSRLSMSLQQKNRNVLQAFSSHAKVSSCPAVDQQPIRPVELHQQCKCAGCMAVLSEEHQAAFYDHAPAIKKKFSSKRSQIFPRTGDHVVVRSHLTGIVRYIGPINDSTQSYIGLHLDAPVGNHNGSLDGKRFFSCPPNYGAFVPVSDVLCITSQKSTRPRKDMRPSVTSLRQRSVSTPLSRPLTVESELPGVEAPV